MTNTKERLLDAAAELFRRQGYSGTGLKRITQQADAPFGPLYHFFPGGKEQLCDAVVRRAGEHYGKLITDTIDSAPDVTAGIGDIFTAATVTLSKSDYADACPVAPIALDVASGSDTLRTSTANVFDSWIILVTEQLERAGIKPESARELAVSTLCILEGAFILGRAQRSTEPIEIARRRAMAAVRAALT